MKYQMIQSDIDNAGRSCIDCPIVKCLERYHSDKEFSASTSWVHIYNREDLLNNKRIYTSVYPSINMIHFISKYDEGKVVSPIEFEIEV